MADGIIIIDKPQDWTSMDVCAKLRGIFHERRIMPSKLDTTTSWMP